MSDKPNTPPRGAGSALGVVGKKFSFKAPSYLQKVEESLALSHEAKTTKEFGGLLVNVERLLAKASEEITVLSDPFLKLSKEDQVQLE